MKSLTNIERTTLWMAIRYACHRGTIACVTLPGDIIKSYGKRLSADDKFFLARDSNYNRERLHENWIKFIAAMDEEFHFTLDTPEMGEKICFEANGRSYLLDDYMEHPEIERYIDMEQLEKLKGK